MAEELSLPHIKVLGDCYHMDLEGESFDVLTEAIKKGLLSHVHIADRKRRFPCEPVDEAGIDFFKAVFCFAECRVQSGDISRMQLV